MNGYRTLEEGLEVEFEVKRGPKGLQAENVMKP
jgi:CspA family cold shock protein